MLISKKDLLAETKISYGQLYRWKREKLIPEEWFIKQPSFTGQETYFPKQKILNRIRAIQELKNKYSLEELAKILSPEIADRYFTTDDLAIIEEIDKGLIPAFVQGFEKNSFTFIEVLLMVALSDLKRQFSLTIHGIITITAGIRDLAENIKSTDFTFVVYDKEYYAAIYPEHTEIFIDSRLNPVKKFSLNDISSKIKLKYRKRFNFSFEEAETKENLNNLKFSY